MAMTTMAMAMRPGMVMLEDMGMDIVLVLATPLVIVIVSDMAIASIKVTIIQAIYAICEYEVAHTLWI